MNKPGLSSSTGPAVSSTRRLANYLYTQSEQLHIAPVAENVADVAYSAVLVIEAAVKVIESVGLDVDEVSSTIATTPAGDSVIPELVKLIRSKY